MNNNTLAMEVIARLKKAYPDAGCTLDYNEAWKLLVSVRLAAQCTDARVNTVVPKLYEKFPDVNALADAPVEEIEEIIHPCGFWRSKAKDISACMKMLRDEYGGTVREQRGKGQNRKKRLFGGEGSGPVHHHASCEIADRPRCALWT